MNDKTASESRWQALIEDRGNSPERATLVDVAEAAEVSRQTVSNVINNPERVAPSTRDRVFREIERLGFQPNRAARALRRQRAGALGIQVNSMVERQLGNILDPFLVELTVAARAHDFHILTFAVDSHADPTAEYEHLVAVQLVDGFVLTNTHKDDPRPFWLRANGVPFVSFGRIWDDPSFTAWVDVDGFAGVAAGVRHLVEQGYTKVGFLGWPVGSQVGDDRRAGWLAATREFGLLAPRLQAASQQDVHAAAAAAAPLLEELGDGGALICASDTLALGAWTVMRDRGLRPGVDVGLVGFDDSDLAHAFEITSIRQPLADIADAMLTLFAGAGSDERRASDRVIKPAVTPRASSTRSPTSPGSPPARTA
jgi:DNA-binding LacI/PurR family transcriptional regulator